MNKKILVVLFLFSIFITVNESFSQCTPNPNNTSLITPDTIVNFVSGTVGIPYSQMVYIHPPIDTTVNVPPLGLVHINPIDSLVLNSITNLPPGLSYACNPSSCVFPGGVSGCLAISGTPTTAGFYQLDITITGYGKLDGTGFAVFATLPIITQYHININTNTAVQEFGQNSNFQLLELGSDPAQEQFTLKMNSPVLTTADFSVFNILGKNVYSKPASLKQGINAIDFSTKSFSPGVYILTLKKDSYILSRRFVIGGK